MMKAPIPEQGRRATHGKLEGTINTSRRPGSVIDVVRRDTSNVIAVPSATRLWERLTTANRENVLIAKSRATKKLIAGRSIRIRCPVG